MNGPLGTYQAKQVRVFYVYGWKVAHSEQKSNHLYSLV